MARPHVAVLVIGIVLLALTPGPLECMGQEVKEVKCSGKYEGGLKPSSAELSEILKQHGAWVKAGGPSDHELANDPRRANFCDANLSYKDLSNADLTGADLNSANLAGARLTGASRIPARSNPQSGNSLYSHADWSALSRLAFADPREDASVILGDDSRVCGHCRVLWRGHL